MWLFYVQHQFEGVYWERGGDWDYVQAALQGSSFYKLPRILQWFSGNIGFHHIHHLSPRIPNYHLEKCHQEEPLFQTVKPVTFFGSFKSLTFRLWDGETSQAGGIWRREKPHPHPQTASQCASSRVTRYAAATASAVDGHDAIDSITLIHTNREG